MKLEISKKRSERAKIPIHYNDDGEIVGEGEVKNEITSEKRFRGPTLKLEIAKKRSEGFTLNIIMMVTEWVKDMYNLCHTWVCLREQWCMSIIQIGGWFLFN